MKFKRKKKKKKVKLGESVKTFHQRKVLKLYIKNFTSFTSKKQPSRVVLIKRFSENMQQIYSRTSMLKCDSNKVAKQLFWNNTSAWVFCKFAAYFLNTFSREKVWWAAPRRTSVWSKAKDEYKAFQLQCFAEHFRWFFLYWSKLCLYFVLCHINSLE